MIYCVHRMPKVKRASGGWRRGLVNIKHLFGRVILLLHNCNKLWDEQRRNNELIPRYVEPWYENIINKEITLGGTTLSEDFEDFEWRFSANCRIYYRLLRKISNRPTLNYSAHLGFNFEYSFENQLGQCWIWDSHSADYEELRLKLWFPRGAVP
jgi:hypothetical protein